MTKFFKGCLGVATALIAVHFALAEVNAGLFDRGCDPCAAVCDPCDAGACGPCDAIACDPCEAACNNGLFQRNSSLFQRSNRSASQWNAGGHIEAGLWGNQWGRTNSYPGVLKPGNSEYLYNAQHTGVQMNQAWFFVERQLNTRRGIDFGGRIDLAYGTDALFLQSDGLEFRSRSLSLNPSVKRGWGDGDYYAAIAQAYAEVGFNNVNVKVGKFLSPFGHESVMSPNRFFYSLSHAFGFQPTTHTGAIATWSPNKKVAFAGGWCSADNTFYNEDDNIAVFGAILTPSKRVSLAYWGAIGQNKSVHNLSQGQYKENYFLQSVVLTLKPNSRWEYTFEWSLCNADDGWPKAERDYFGYYGINN